MSSVRTHTARKQVYTLVGAAWLFFAGCALPAWPQGSGDEEPYAPTPTTLPELIEGVGLEAIDWDVWTVVLQEGEPIVHTRSRAYVDGGVVVFAEYVQVLRTEIYASIWLYSAEGVLLEMRGWDRRRMRGGFEADGQWWLRARYTEGQTTLHTVSRHDDTQQTRDLEFQPYDRAVAEHLLPLAYRYHIARGHERFELSLDFSLIGNSSKPRLRRYEHIGTELNELDGVETACVVYQVSELIDADAGEAEGNVLTSFLVVTETGQMVREWYDNRPPETDGECRSPPGEVPDPFPDNPMMLEGGIGNDVFGEVDVGGGGEQGAADDEE